MKVEAIIKATDWHGVIDVDDDTMIIEHPITLREFNLREHASSAVLADETKVLTGVVFQEDGGIDLMFAERRPPRKTRAVETIEQIKNFLARRGIFDTKRGVMSIIDKFYKG